MVNQIFLFELSGDAACENENGLGGEVNANQVEWHFSSL